MPNLRHLAIIPDGNRRWAKDQGLPVFEGHRQGYEQVKTIGLAALAQGIEQFTLWGFSTENWKRSEQEISFILDLFFQALTRELDFYLQHSIRLRVIGDRTAFSLSLQRAIEQAEVKTQNGTRGQFNLCMNYGGRAEIIHGIKKIMDSGLSSDQVDEQVVSSFLWTKDLLEPDLIIRTSGEQRLSGFFSWLSTYSELLFEDVYWPAFSVNNLNSCVQKFNERQRRFGA